MLQKKIFAFILLVFSLSANNPLIFVLSSPRNMTTALERSFHNRGDLKIIHEPFAGLFWKFQDNATGYDEDIPTFIRSTKDFSGMCHKLLDETENGPVFIKDFAFTTHPQILKEQNFLQDSRVKFVFLIRKPCLAIASMYNKTSEFMEFTFNYKGLYEIFLKVWELKRIKPLIIEVEDLLENPETTLKKICDFVDIPFSEKMLKWDAGMLDMWKCLGSWHKSAANSTSFEKRKDVENPLENIPIKDRDRMKNLYKKNIAYYYKLKDAEKK
jgi:hypothetical protein